MARSFLDRWVNRLKTSAREEIQETARSALHYVVLYAIAAVAGLIALVFLTLAVFWWLSVELSPIPAALVVTIFYAIVAAVVVIWASWNGAVSGASSAPQPQKESAEPEEAAYGSTPDMTDMMGVNLDSVAGTLAGAGFRTESLVVSASSEVLKQLTPLQFVAFVFVGSFLFGRRLRRR